MLTSGADGVRQGSHHPYRGQSGLHRRQHAASAKSACFSGRGVRVQRQLPAPAAHGGGGARISRKITWIFTRTSTDIQQTFGKFLALLPATDGLAVGNGDDPRVRGMSWKSSAAVDYTFGLGEGCDYRPGNLRYERVGPCGHYDLSFRGEELGHVKLKVAGCVPGGTMRWRRWRCAHQLGADMAVACRAHGRICRRSPPLRADRRGRGREAVPRLRPQPHGNAQRPVRSRPCNPTTASGP